MRGNDDLKETLARLSEELSQERDRVDQLEELTGGPVEREPGLWEYGFDELEAEMWRRFAFLEASADCTTDEEIIAAQGLKGKALLKIKNLWRSLSGTFSRTVIDKRKQFNLDQQNRINQENIPFYLASVLVMQKIKDRLNHLEESLARIEKDQEGIVRELTLYAQPGETVAGNENQGGRNG